MKIILVAGARPNFMKIAPIIRSIHRRNKECPVCIHYLLVHTGQHYDYEMSQIFFEDLEIPRPDFNLGVGSGSHAEQTGRVMIEFEKVLLKNNPDLVIVVGDVNSTLAAALTATKLCLPVAHVEAGLRCFDRTMPEEINRFLTDHIADYLFTTSNYDDENLKRECIPSDKIFCVGNIMIDSLLFNKQKAEKSNILSQLSLTKQNYALLTLHRPSNVDDKGSLLKIISALVEIVKNINIVFPIHPRTRKRLREFDLLKRPLFNNKRFLMIDPSSYLDFLKLEMNAKFIMTDSGGIQEETTVLDIPCLTLRDSTERPITVTQGTNTIVWHDTKKIIEEAYKIMDGKGKKGDIPALWDGKTAERIISIISQKIK